MRLKPDHLSFMMDQINSWSVEDGVLTVPKLLARLEAKYGDKPSDRAIRKYPNITQRIAQRKEEIKSGIPANQTSNKSPKSLVHAAMRIEALEKEVAELKEKNTRLIHQFVVWQKNATDHGMTKAQLNRPLHVDLLHHKEDK